MVVMTMRPDRLNVLLTDVEEPWSQQLPRLLEPQGVRAIRVHSVDQALRVLEQEQIHAVLVDMALPLEAGSSTVGAPGGLKLLRVLRRLTPSPPAVVVRGRLFDTRLDDRLLSEALKLDAFSVLDEPVQLEQLLQVMRRLLERFYGGFWPSPES
jgi:CheY-like chemotaxis protein